MNNHLNGITHCTFTCKNYSEMVYFYSNILGLKKKFILNYEPEIIDGFKSAGYLDCKKSVNDEWLSYYEVAPKQFIELFNLAYNGSNETENTGFHHICFFVNDINEAKKELEHKNQVLYFGPTYRGNKNTGENLQESLFWPGQKSFFIKDPEGNEIEFMEAHS